MNISGRKFIQIGSDYNKIYPVKIGINFLNVIADSKEFHQLQPMIHITESVNVNGWTVLKYKPRYRKSITKIIKRLLNAAKYEIRFVN
jgi:hypothetical protein